MADENTPNEDDVEAEMMRMMQEELSGGEDNTDDNALADMAALMGGEEGGEGNIDDMLEQEMLKAMQADTGDSEDAGFGSALALGGQTSASAGATPDGIEKLADVDVNVTVEIGGTSIPIKDIMEWTRDSIVELERMEDDPVEVLVNGQLFARGEVVVVGDTFGVRIVELVDHPKEPSFER